MDQSRELVGMVPIGSYHSFAEPAFHARVPHILLATQPAWFLEG